MMFYPWMFPMMMQPIPTIDEQPPTIYYLLRAIVNDNSIKTNELADKGRSEIFDFTYPLSANINKKDFECMILNKFMMRRIGTQTLTAFKLNLNVKLNEIMPMYNKLFDSIEGWNLFEDGESVTREQTDDRTTNTTNNTISSSDTTSNSSVLTETENSNTNTYDKRYSNTPQNSINDVKDGHYITEYNYDTEKNLGNNNSNSISNSSGNDRNNTQSNTNLTDNYNLLERIKRTPSDKIKIYKDFIESKNNIYTMIFKDLESLFYQLV